MKKNYITPKMLAVNVETAPLCLSMQDDGTPAQSGKPALAKRRGRHSASYDYEEDIYGDSNDFDEE